MINEYYGTNVLEEYKKFVYSSSSLDKFINDNHESILDGLSIELSKIPKDSVIKKILTTRIIDKGKELLNRISIELTDGAKRIYKILKECNKQKKYENLEDKYIADILEDEDVNPYMSNMLLKLLRYGILIYIRDHDKMLSLREHLWIDYNGKVIDLTADRLPIYVKGGNTGKKYPKPDYCPLILTDAPYKKGIAAFSSNGNKYSVYYTIGESFQMKIVELVDNSEIGMIDKKYYSILGNSALKNYDFISSLDISNITGL